MQVQTLDKGSVVSAAPARAKLTVVKPSLRQAPLRVMPFAGVLDMTCRHCGLSTQHSVGQLISEGRFGGCSVDDLEDALVCQRPSCIGPLMISVSLPD